MSRLPVLALAVPAVLAVSLAMPRAGAQEADGAAETAAPDAPSSDWPAPESVAAHAAEVEAYRADREARLRQPESWLTLVGLHWLQEGTNTLGSGDGMDVRLPAALPDFVGELTLTVAGDARTVVLTPADGVAVRVDGEAATAPVELRNDAGGEPSQVEVGSVVFYAIERRDRIAVRIKDREAKTLREFAGLEHYPIDWRWRVEARYVPYEEDKEIQVPSVLGGSDPASIPGALEFEIAGTTYRLDPLPEGDSLFVIFGDATNGDSTYGGGRFLYVDAPPASNRPGRVVLDFNKAYSPPCVFSPWATCPLPPRQNRLALAVEAGEKMYHGFTEGSH